MVSAMRYFREYHNFPGKGTTAHPKYRGRMYCTWGLEDKRGGEKVLDAKGPTRAPNPQKRLRHLYCTEGCLTVTAKTKE